MLDPCDIEFLATITENKELKIFNLLEYRTAELLSVVGNFFSKYSELSAAFDTKVTAT